MLRNQVLSDISLEYAGKSCDRVVLTPVFLSSFYDFFCRVVRRFSSISDEGWWTNVTHFWHLYLPSYISFSTCISFCRRMQTLSSAFVMSFMDLCPTISLWSTVYHGRVCRIRWPVLRMIFESIWRDWTGALFGPPRLLLRATPALFAALLICSRKLSFPSNRHTLNILVLYRILS